MERNLKISFSLFALTCVSVVGCGGVGDVLTGIGGNRVDVTSLSVGDTRRGSWTVYTYGRLYSSGSGTASEAYLSAKEVAGVVGANNVSGRFCEDKPEAGPG